MEPTSRHLLDQLVGLREQVDCLRAETMTHEMMGKAVTAGILAAVSDPNMWHSAMLAMQTKAKAEAGGWLFGGLRAMLSKLAWAAMR